MTHRLDERGSARALAIAQRHVVDSARAGVAGRDVGVDDVVGFLDPTIKRLMPDPSAMTDMTAASVRIADAVIGGNRIAIFGDYDVDGATASALLCSYLRRCGIDPDIHIPDRIFEGYGPNVDAIRSFAERGIKLLITVDCGVTSLEPLAEAKRLGLDTVVIDHHQADEKLRMPLPSSTPIVRMTCPGLGRLAAVGFVFVTWSLPHASCAGAIFGALRAPSPTCCRSCILWHSAPSPMLCRCVVSIVLSLPGLDRTPAARTYGPDRAYRCRAPFRPAGSVALGFVMGPRVDAGGRIGRADLGVRLLLRTVQRGSAHCDRLDRLNCERQQIDSTTLAQAEAEGLAALGLEEQGAVVVDCCGRLAPGMSSVWWPHI